MPVVHQLSGVREWSGNPTSMWLETGVPCYDTKREVLSVKKDGITLAEIDVADLLNYIEQEHPDVWAARSAERPLL